MSEAGTNAAPPPAMEPGVGAEGAMLIVISGPSGVGKDTVLQHLKKRQSHPPRHYVVTYKSRPRRSGEVDGIDYHFVTDQDFTALNAAGRLLEANQVHGHWSGTPRDQVLQALQSGRDAVLKIDVQGARKIRERTPDALLIFIAPPSFDDLVRRLERRGTETATELARRQADAAEELAHQVDYDHIVVNETGRAQVTADRIDEIIAAEHKLHPGRRVRI